MKKKDVLSLIKYHCESDDDRFKEVAHSIAMDFDKSGDARLAEFILGYISETNTLSIQMLEGDPAFYTRLKPSPNAPSLPDAIQLDVKGIYNAITRKTDVSKFLLYGPPGTGKTEYVKNLAYLLDRELLFIEFDTIVNSKLGETTKNIRGLFDEIRHVGNPDGCIFLFDEIDALAMDRVNSSDLREMGRATSAFLKEMDRTSGSFLMFATTNLFKHLDDALIRRFDAAIDFGRYGKEDLSSISEALIDDLLNQYSFASRDKRLFKKIIDHAEKLPYPGELKNQLKKSIVFSDEDDEYDYLKRLYCSFFHRNEIDPEVLRNEGFTLREIEKLTNIPKSTLSRMGCKLEVAKS